MPVLFLALSFSLLASPLYTQALFRSAYQWERAQIELDNASIELGRSDRDLLNWLKTKALQIRVWDKAHDGVHLCARVPSYQASACRVWDKVWEKQLMGIRREVSLMAQLRWAGTAHKAVRAIHQAGLRLKVMQRLRRLPMHWETCPRCGLRVQAGLRNLPLVTSFRLLGASALPIESKVELVGHSLSQRESWSFRMRPSLSENQNSIGGEGGYQ